MESPCPQRAIWIGSRSVILAYVGMQEHEGSFQVFVRTTTVSRDGLCPNLRICWALLPRYLTTRSLSQVKPACSPEGGLPVAGRISSQAQRSVHKVEREVSRVAPSAAGATRTLSLRHVTRCLRQSRTASL